MPLVASIGAHAGAAKPIVFCSVLSISAAMALPMSSFPNVHLQNSSAYTVPSAPSTCHCLHVWVPLPLTVACDGWCTALRRGGVQVNSLLAEDDYGVPYLTPKDYMRAGVLASCAVILPIVTVGYPLATLL